MATYSFSPPTRGNYDSSIDIDPIEARKNILGNKMSRHFSRPPIAVNVFVMAAGNSSGLAEDTITEQQPTYVTDYKRVYYGAHATPVTLAEKTLLESAGYTVDTLA